MIKYRATYKIYPIYGLISPDISLVQSPNKYKGSNNKPNKDNNAPSITSNGTLPANRIATTTAGTR